MDISPHFNAGYAEPDQAGPYLKKFNDDAAVADALAEGMRAAVYSSFRNIRWLLGIPLPTKQEANDNVKPGSAA
jgi:hypothetical protein